MNPLPRFHVIPNCEFYMEDGSCKRSNKAGKKFSCNEMLCEKKIEQHESKFI